MQYNKKSNVGYGNRKPLVKLPKKAHIVLSLEGGHLGEVHVIIDPKKAKAKRDELAKEHDLIGKQYTEGHNKECKDCRQSDLDEDEVHLHKVNVE